MGKKMNWEKNKFNQKIYIEDKDIRAEREYENDFEKACYQKCIELNEKILFNPKTYETKEYNDKILFQSLPEDDNTRVECLHCRNTFLLKDMKFEYRPSGSTPFLGWWCYYQNCNGAGYGIDIHPITSNLMKRR